MQNRMNIVCDGDSCCLIDDEPLQPVQLQPAQKKQQKISQLMSLLGIPAPTREAVRANYDKLGESEIDLRIEKLSHSESPHSET